MFLADFFVPATSAGTKTIEETAHMNGGNQETAHGAIRWLLILSFTINAALAVAALKLSSKPTAPFHEASRPTIAVTLVTQHLATAESPAETLWVTNRFSWRQVESTNYEDYVANLRAIGCPANTLRDIVVADVARHFDTRRREVRIDLPFWTGGKKLKEAERARDAQINVLNKEEESLLQRLLDIEWSCGSRRKQMERFEEQALARFILGPMDDEKFWQTLRIVDQGQEFRNKLNARTGGILTEADENESRGLALDLLMRLENSLSPIELEEMLARKGALELFKNDALESLDLTPAEARQIGLARSGGGMSPDFFGLSLDESPEVKELHEYLFTNSVARLLGGTRFADFQRVQDSEFQRLYELTAQHQLPKETAIKVYDMRQLAADEVARVRADTSLDDAARQQKFEQMQTELRKAVSGELGSSYKDYLRSNGRWITNVTKL